MNKIAVGKISKTFGQGGDVVVSLFEAFDGAADGTLNSGSSNSSVHNQEPLHVVLDGLEVPLFIDHFERRGRTGALVRFADVDTPQRAEMLVGKELFFGGSMCEESEDFADVVGWQVEMWVESESGDAACNDAKSPIHGIVTAFLGGAMNPLLQVEIGSGDGGEKDEVLLPLAFVGEVNNVAKKITFTLPEGLLDLNK